MRPTETLAREKTPEGDELVLTCRDGVYHLIVDNVELMTSRVHGSEEDLARLACEAIAGRKTPRVLVGGLGFGYTLRAALDHSPPDATVVVCEVFPSLLDWNRKLLGYLAREPLEDRRVKVVLADVRTLFDGRERFDAILLDVDNGPGALTDSANAALYSSAGIAAAHASLNPGGTLALWSAREDRKFEHRLRSANFTTKLERTRAHANNKGPRHTIYLAQKSQSP
jgi:spermidine synthase